MSSTEMTDAEVAAIANGDPEVFDKIERAPEPEVEAVEEKEEGQSVIVGKDGKSIIPFEVLEQERRERERLEVELRKRDAEMEELRTKSAGPLKLPEEFDASARIQEMNDRIELLREAGETEEAEAVERDREALEKSQKVALESYEFKHRYEQEEARRAEEFKRAQAEELTATLKANPILSFYREKHPELYDKVAVIDEQAVKRGSPRYFDEKGELLPLSTRAKVALDDFFRDNPKAPMPAEVKTEKDIDAIVAERLAAAAAKGTKGPDGLGDIPGGVSPSGGEAIDELPGMAVVQATERMSDEQYQRWVSSQY